MEFTDFFGLPYLPVLASEHGAKVDLINEMLHWLMIVLMVGWMAYFFYTLFRFKSGSNKNADYHGVRGHTGSAVELGVIVFEFFILLGFSLPFVVEWTVDFPKQKDALTVRIVAEQFSWHFHYAGPDGKFGRTDARFFALNPLGIDPSDPNGKDDLDIANVLHIPIGRDVIAHITAKDVIHSFGVPAFRIKQDATPGITVPIAFKAIREGKFPILCSQLCGAAHTFMRGEIAVHSAGSYESWLKKQL